MYICSKLEPRHQTVNEPCHLAELLRVWSSVQSSRLEVISTIAVSPET